MSTANTPSATAAQRQPVYYLSHGGGPWPFMNGPFRDIFAVMEKSLQDLPYQLPEAPRAILIISSHWEADVFSVSASPQPPMIYDYFGFPDALYRIQYPAPGHPELAHQVASLLQDAGWDVDIDPHRGYDHATYSLLKPIYPEANIPVVQLSMRVGFDPAEHIAVGRALSPLRDQGILILGSGQSFHNLRERGKQSLPASEMFDLWLRQSLLNRSAEERSAALVNWEKAPYARLAHPQEDHLIPLMVAAGAAGDDHAVCVFGDYVANFATSAYRFGGDTATSPYDVLQLHTRQGSA
ncbi:dioxygenase [Curvibacter sp. CHRR-16]|uniref:DODA-type extradiol aromatic ring-opening family dioxygenase n=1 Tax=Curvibacter sp. CHRR-16 TaxID=2835872 RepID=UPI001BD9977D|nr:class III extradiol ring-cleavage dioxygenase [Curvibacter sp. CHRR-16]MBT0569854.1 dioxygenase [Curvibacter sp. CHRR-16]